MMLELQILSKQACTAGLEAAAHFITTQRFLKFQARPFLRGQSCRCKHADPPLRRRIGHLSRLGKAKAGVAFMQGDHEAVSQLLLALILNQVQLVEAGVRRGQLLLAPICLVNRELL